MMLTDHLNLLGMAGQNPLRGPNLDSLGPRFPDMSQVYDRKLQSIVRLVAEEEKIQLREGVYCCLAGPSFETPADLRFLRGVGVDAVGMSTVPEAIVARHMGLEVLGLSCITNVAAGLSSSPIATDEVIGIGGQAAPRVQAVLEGVLARL
jgi:purine-nucleoside phosphorylase